MPPNNCDPGDRRAGLALEDESCPECGTEMEPIDIAVEDLPLRELRLCPDCYLVTWTDDTGFQVRQGVPVRKGQPSQWAESKPN
jgi:hypothetical protein